jgi:hypothetical protein
MDKKGKGVVDAQGLFLGFGPLAPSPLYSFSKFAGCNMVKFCELTKFLNQYFWIFTCFEGLNHVFSIFHFPYIFLLH